MGIKVLIADDHRMICAALGMLLDREPDITIVSEAYDCWTTLQLAKETMPDVIVMSMSMMAENGFEPCRNILGKLPQSRIIALSLNTDRRHVVEAFKAGVRGYVLKESASEVLVRAIRNVAGNNGYMDPKINDVIIYEQREYSHEPDLRNKQKVNSHEQSAFSPHKQLLFQLLAEGKNPKEIACVLKVSHKTVEAHRRKISHQLGLGSVEDLTRHLKEMGCCHAQPALSPREQEILKLIAEGRNIKEVAFSLDISSKSVETYRRRIRQKLNLKNEADLTRYAIREELISL